MRYAFIGFGYSESFGSPAAAQALQDYNTGKGSFSAFALPALESFQRLINAGVFRPEDLEVRYPHREQMLFERKCAMVSDGLALAELAKKRGNMDEFGVMPFFCLGERNAWGHLTPNQYIGLNQHLTRSENKEKYQLALQLMDFVSTPEGQLALANNNTSLISSLKNSRSIETPELKSISEAIDRNQYAIFPSLTNADEALYDALAALLRGQIDQQEVIKRIDAQNRNPQPQQRSRVIGTAGETFSLTETGNYVTDVLRAYTGADLSLFLDNGKDGLFNAKGISAKFYQGGIRESDVVQRVLPTLQHGEAGYLHIVTISGKNLPNVLEFALPSGGWFYYFSGLKMTYDPTEEPGRRIQKLTQEDGEAIDPEKLYRVAVMEGSIDEQWIEQCELTEQLVKDIVIADIREKKVISPKRDGRFQLP